MNRLGIAFLTACLAAAAGCAPDNGLDLARVSGKVTMKGQPVTNGTIMFVPDEAKGTTGPQAIGTIKSDGTYVLSSESAADGAVVGHHKVGILGLEAEPASQEAAPDPEEDPLKYLAAKTKAGLEATKNRKKSGGMTVTGLDGKPFRVVVPEKYTNSETSGIAVEVTSGSNTFDIDVVDDETANVNK